MITLTATSLLKARVHIFYSGIGTSSEFHAYQLYTRTHTRVQSLYTRYSTQSSNIRYIFLECHVLNIS